MRIAVAGKGGTGKTTIAGTLARTLARRGRAVLAIDADTNPNLASIVGIPPAQAEALATLPLDLLERREDPGCPSRTITVFTADPDAIADTYAVTGPDGVRLMVMGRVGHAGAG